MAYRRKTACCWTFGPVFQNPAQNLVYAHPRKLLGTGFMTGLEGNFPFALTCWIR